MAESDESTGIGHITAELRGAWRTMVAIVLGMCVGALPAYSIGVFVGPISKELHWSATQVFGWSLAYAAGCIVAAPGVGIIADRVGARRVALTALTALAVALAGTSLPPRNLGVLYLFGLGVGAASTGTSAMIYGPVISTPF